MKIVSETPDRLVIIERPWLLVAFHVAMIGGLGFYLWRNWTQTEAWLQALLAANGFLLMVSLRAFAHFVEVRFERFSGQVVIERRGVLLRRRETYPYAAFQAAKSVEFANDEGETRRLVLEFDPHKAPAEFANRKKGDAGVLFEAPATWYYSNDRGPIAVAEAINAWRDGRARPPG